MKDLIQYFIRYHVAGNILIIAIVVFGLIGLKSTSSSYFPLVPVEKISVSVSYPGASPLEIEEGIVQKIEEELKGISGIDRVTSTSSENSGTITIELIKGVNINTILVEIKNAVDGINNYPSGMENPSVAKVESTRETLSFSISSNEMSLKHLKDFAKKIESDLLGLNGISQVELSGFPEEEIEVRVKEEVLRAYDLTIQDVANAISNTNFNSTGGKIKALKEDYSIRVKNKYYYANELENIIVKSSSDGALIRLQEVTDIVDQFSEDPNQTYVNGERAIVIDVKNTSEEDLLQSAKLVKTYLKSFEEKNKQLKIIILKDSSKTLEERTDLLITNGWQGILLVVLFLGIFLDRRIAFWVAFGLPVSFLGFFIFSNLLNVTINVLSLFGLIMVIGILVDDGIVIAENIYHHYEKGKSKIRAAMDGISEVLPSIVSAVLTTVVAFTTFFFVEGRLGYYFSEVSIVVITTLLVSLVEGVLLLPAHLTHSKALTRKHKMPLINAWAERFMERCKISYYEPVLRWVLKNRFITICSISALFLMTIGANQGGIIKFSFFPNVASEKATVTLEMPQGTSEKTTDSLITFIEKRAWEVSHSLDEEYFKSTPEKHAIKFVQKNIGPGTHKGTLKIFLLSNEERPFSSGMFSQRLREAVGDIYGVQTLTYDSGGHFGGSPISIALGSENRKNLNEAVSILKQSMISDPRLVDVKDDNPKGLKEIQITLKPNAYFLGFNLSSVSSQVRDGFFGREAQSFQRSKDEIKVWVRYNLEGRRSIKNLDDMELISPTTQKRVPFSTIANYTIRRGEVNINHTDAKRVITVSSDIGKSNETASDILIEIKKGILADILQKYPDIKVLLEGQARESQKVVSSAKKAMGPIFIIILLLISFTFRTYGKALLFIPIILFSMISVMWGHWLHGLPINILSMLGIVALIGVLVNDGLVFISKFNGKIKEGLSLNEAIIEAGKSRFRAIFLTTLTTVAGLTPLLFETSRNAQFLIPMAISVVYGIAFATVLTLILLPVLLSYENSVKRLFYWIWTGTWPEPRSIERATLEMKYEQIDLTKDEE